MHTTSSITPKHLRTSSRFQRTSWLVALLAGALLPFAFAPFNLYALGILCPALLLATWLPASPKKSFLLGGLFGVGLFGAGVSWVYVSLNTYGQGGVVFSSLLTAGFILLLAFFTAALPGFLFKRFFKHYSLLQCIFAFPALWVLFEWARTTALTGFPWLLLGYTQLHSPLRGFAPIGSVYFISLITAITAGILVYSLQFRLQLKKTTTPQTKKTNLLPTVLALLVLLALWVTGGLLAHHHWTQPIGKSLTVSLVQGNIPQTLKWQPNQAANTFDIYRTLTEQHWNSDLIVWPEAAMPFVYESDPASALSVLSQQAKQHHTALLLGILLEDGHDVYNGMIALGNAAGSYRKRHLVPFGEFLPFRSLLAYFKHYVMIPMSDFTAGALPQPAIMAHGIKLASFICYEIIYPRAVLRDFPAANLIVVISDDSWFGDSLAPIQQLQMTQMRALETGRYALSATNNGVTAIINPSGNITALAPSFIRTVLTGNIQPMQGNTPLMYWHLWPVWLLCGLFLLIARGHYPSRLLLARLARRWQGFF